jgi:hypothetical protein
MADAPAASKSPLEFLKQKVGPLPLGVWLLAGVGIWWYMSQRQASSAAAANQQTDPAGNVGTIDPATGYVQGSPEDTASLAAQNSGSSSSTTGAGSGATSGAQTYADNNAWGIAAVNYLVGLGIDGVTANQAVGNYLNSQPLTSSEQGDVNLAITALGPPPSLPGPVSTNPTPVSTTGSSGTTSTGGGSGTTGAGTNPAKSATPVISAGRVVHLSNNGAVIAWTGTGATQWRVTRVGPGGTVTNTVGIPQATYSGLSAGHNYEVTIQSLVNGQPAGSPGKIDFKTT